MPTKLRLFQGMCRPSSSQLKGMGLGGNISKNVGRLNLFLAFFLTFGFAPTLYRSGTFGMEAVARQFATGEHV
jgi:hypothetical protein